MTAWAGRSLPRFEDPAILRGAGRYVADAVVEADCLYGVFVRSPVAAARLLEVRVPGDVLAFTAKDLAGVSGICPGRARCAVPRPGQYRCQRNTVHRGLPGCL